MSGGPAATATDTAARPRGWSNTVGAVIGTASGLLPHLLHHIGLFAGTAVLAGATGAALFGLLGLAAMVPMLLRLRRRFATWWAPAVALVIFVVMFTLSAVVLGPALRAATSDPPTHEPASTGPVPTPSHGDHHR
jgi:hypothetical protein